MLRTLDMALVVLMVAAAAATYQIKHHAEQKLEEVRRLQTSLRTEKQTIDLLEADWALLNQPSRLQTLVERFKEELQLETIEAEQIATPAELPSKLLQIEELIAAPIEPMPDPTITGSVVR